MELENILSEASQTHKDKNCMLSIICEAQHGIIDYYYYFFVCMYVCEYGIYVNPGTSALRARGAY